jgi:selenocysteine lyase/cysteine desulfurase
MAAAPVSAPPLRRYRDEFPIFRQAIYLNSCSLGALSRRSRVRVNEYLDLWESRGAAAWYDTWWSALDELRTRYGRMIGAAGADIALEPNISAALTSVAESLDYRLRRKVVITRLDFPTVAYQWLARAGEGIELVMLDSPDEVHVPLEAFERAVDERTALVATSHVFFTSGAIQDVKALAEIAHRRGALLLVDGYHAVGQLPVDIHKLDPDFYCSGGLKWLLGGSGTAFLYVRSELASRLEPRATGWFGHKDQFRFDPEQLVLHEDARRFQGGTPGMAAVYAQLGGLDVLEELGAGEIRRATMALTEELIERARAGGFKPKVATSAESRSGIVMLPSDDPAAAVRRLASAKVITDARPGHVRVSPYFYNVSDDFGPLLELLTP